MRIGQPYHTVAARVALNSRWTLSTYCKASDWTDRAEPTGGPDSLRLTGPLEWAESGEDRQINRNAA